MGYRTDSSAVWKKISECSLNCTSDIFSNCTRKPFDFLVIIWSSKIFWSKKNSLNKCQKISARRKLLQVARGNVSHVLPNYFQHFDWLKLTAHWFLANQQERFHFFAHVWFRWFRFCAWWFRKNHHVADQSGSRNFNGDVIKFKIAILF